MVNIIKILEIHFLRELVNGNFFLLEFKNTLHYILSIENGYKRFTNKKPDFAHFWNFGTPHVVPFRGPNGVNPIGVGNLSIF